VLANGLLIHRLILRLWWKARLGQHVADDAGSRRRIQISSGGWLVARCATVAHITRNIPSGQRQHRSFRFPEGTLERLDSRAKQIRETRTALAERYVDEGLRMDEHPGIAFADGPAGRRAVLAGSGLDVWEVIETLRQNRNSLDATARYLERPAATLRPAVRYYAAFPDEIDDRITLNEEVARTFEEAARRERAVLG
jgi:uncharacterized protein (DUF433 family)